MGKLIVVIEEARNVHNPQTLGTVDPYVKISCENKVYKTEVAESTTDPKWSTRFVFQVADENSAQIEFTLWNSNLVSDDFLGEYSLSISGLTYGETKDEWYLLQQSKSNAELRVSLTAEDFGKIPSDNDEEEAAATPAPPGTPQACGEAVGTDMPPMAPEGQAEEDAKEMEDGSSEEEGGPQCKRRGCPYQRHTSQGHGFCCWNCRGGRPHGRMCERTPAM